ncbi:unnamed protein product [Urochloa decumbens]|uniref:BTB domain-containing protein n=1 Tax=Urochloa decumbens TaxID=240449 RepID=A0ABC9BP54_9POAL
MFGAGFVEFKLDYPEKKPAFRPFIRSEPDEDLSAGGHLWRINCSMYQDHDKSSAGYFSFCVTLVSKSEDVKAVFEAFLLNIDGTPSNIVIKRCVKFYEPELTWMFSQHVQRSDLEMTGSTTGFVRLMCGVIVVSENPKPMPPPDIGNHLGCLLDSGVGTDVSFIVDGEQFPAHRAVLAARSPVFQAELFGSMADATMPSIMVQDIEPAAFKVMLRFMYTDSLPEDVELGNPPTDMLQHLLAAADRYALDRLKLICSLKLIECVSVGTVGSILVSAETYNCLELKKKCFNFFALEKNFRKVVSTGGFEILLQKFPSLAAELRRVVIKHAKVNINL